MKSKLFLLFTLFVIVLCCVGVYNNERQLKYGRTFFLKLRPVDPRSIIQGDYMRLNYDVRSFYKDGGCLAVNELGVGVGPGEHGAPKGCLDAGYIWLDKLPVATFFMQEGHAKFYDNARYAIFKYDGKEGAILAGLAGEDFMELGPNAPISGAN